MDALKALAADLLARLPGPASPQWPQGERFVRAFGHGSMTLELYAPLGRDPQQPHEQDELYIVHRGRGVLVVDGVRHAVEAGAAFFVPARVPHRFEDFSDDFATWVVFWGPPGGERA
jgi:mannose-6-phosphate isomerase-like protein (cupin superfamily)